MKANSDTCPPDDLYRQTPIKVKTLNKNNAKVYLLCFLKNFFKKSKM